MIKQDSSTLESIIQAARAMSGIPKSAPKPEPKAPLQSEAAPEQKASFTPKFTPAPEVTITSEPTITPEVTVTPEATTIPEATVTPAATTIPEATLTSESAPDTVSASTSAHRPELQAEVPVSLHTVGIHFLEFAVAFLTLSKCQYQQDCGLKVNSLAFFTLIALDSWADEDFTMSELAEKLQITKQQLSRLINDLEEKGLVERIHDTANRRRVYIRICNSGRQVMNSLKQDMLASTLHGLRAYNPAELAQMDACICRLVELMEKFNTEPSGEY